MILSREKEKFKMFRSASWRGEKNKIKSVFKLQFHATQLVQLGGDALMISVIPADVGKPTSKLEKSKVRDGSCYWEKPIYETAKFSRDQKTGKFHEKLYYFVVAKDSSRFGGVGEVLIDFASYVEATKISSLSLPLKNANSGGLLHVLIQRVQGSFDQRDIVGSENASHHDRSLRTYFNNGDLEGSVGGNGNPTDDHITVNGINSNHRASIESDIMLSSSDDSSTSTLGETYEECSSNAMIQNLKVKVAALTRQTDVSELELQTLRKQIVKETKKNQDLSKELTTLKKEVKVKVNGMLLIDEGDPWVLLEELRQELNHEKELSSNLRLQLQNTRESESKSMYSNTDDDEEQRELEAIVRAHSGVKETYLLEQKIIDLYNEIELYKRDKDELEMQMEQIALDYEILNQENHDISYKLERSQLQEQLNIQDEYELESKSNVTIQDLESRVKNLENELENQARGFAIDFEELLRAKTENEQRAIRAEDSLRKTRFQNADVTTSLQEELRRLSRKMSTNFEVNEKAAMKAMDEANKLRVEKRVLEDTLVKVCKTLQHFGDCFQEKLLFLENQIIVKSKQLEKIKKEIESMTEIRNLESERVKELAIDSSGSFFLLKEKDLQLEIKELERKLDVLVQKTEDSQ